MLYDKKWVYTFQPTLKPWQRLLLDAADLLEKYGWCQGSYHNRQHQFCMVGAVWAAAKTEVLNTAVKEASNHLIEITGPDITGWNDRPERTREEIIAALRKAADAG